MKHLFKTAISLILVLSLGCNKQEQKKEVAQTQDQAIAPKATEITQSQVESISASNGENIEYYPDGKVKIKGVKGNGMRQGKWISLYPDGKTWSECEYKDGLKHGINISYYPNGKKFYEGRYKNDAQVGVWRYYSENGALSQEVDYDKKK